MNFKKTFLIIFFTLAVLSRASIAKASILGFDTTSPCTYWKDVFDFGVKAAGILTLAMLIIGGMYYIFSLGQEEKLGRAKDIMTGAMAGFALAIFSWLIFKVVAPSLLQCEINVPRVEQPEPSTTGGPGGSSDPCAGVADEDLFNTQAECQSSGGSDGGSCSGACVQNQASSSSTPNQSCTIDTDCPSGQQCIGATTDPEGQPTHMSGSCRQSDGSSTRAGWCCISGGGCSHRRLQGMRETRESSGGVYIRDCSEPGVQKWCYNSRPSGTNNACVAEQVVINPNLCNFIINGLTGQTPNPVQLMLIAYGHHKCATCPPGTPPDRSPEGGCQTESCHWTGNGLDIRNDDAVQQWLMANSGTFHITQMIGPAGLENSERVREICRAPRDRRGASGNERFYSPYNIPNNIRASILCAHFNHIHLCFGR